MLGQLMVEAEWDYDKREWTASHFISLRSIPLHSISWGPSLQQTRLTSEEKLNSFLFLSLHLSVYSSPCPDSSNKAKFVSPPPIIFYRKLFLFLLVIFLLKTSTLCLTLSHLCKGSLTQIRLGSLVH
jgi:hypothetical protein